jgi:myosin-5
VQEILSFICVAESDAQQGIAPGMDEPGARELDWEAYERLVGIVKHDLDSLEYNIYHTWMLEVKKKLSKMVIPALIESQSLPGFITADGNGRMLSRMIGMGGGSNQPSASMDDILNLLNKVWKCLKSYYMEESVMQQVVTELLKLIGTIAFNDLILRRNFCSWKRGESAWASCVMLTILKAMQIQYNITRIEGENTSRY